LLILLHLHLIREPSVEAREAEAVALVGDGRVAVCAATEAALPSPPSEGAVKTAVNVIRKTDAAPPPFLRGAAMFCWEQRHKKRQ
jgi:hypothetical protein